MPRAPAAHPPLVWAVIRIDTGAGLQFGWVNRKAPDADCKSAPRMGAWFDTAPTHQ